MAATIVSGGNQFLDPQAILQGQLRLALGNIVADFGCGGAGFFTLAAARLVGERGQVYAVDILKHVLESVDGKAKLSALYNIKTVWSDLEVYDACNIPESSLDHGLLVNTLFQSKKHQEIIREVSRLIKPGGNLLIVEWNDKPTPFGPRPEDRVSLDWLRSEVPARGYVEEKLFEAGAYHYGLIFNRL